MGLGMVIGVTASWVLSTFKVVRFPEGLARVYMVDNIPFHPVWTDLIAVAVVCLALVAMASLWPAWRASREDPVAALKAV